jgi:hypothetical protein
MRPTIIHIILLFSLVFYIIHGRMYVNFTGEKMKETNIFGRRKLLRSLDQHSATSDELIFA